MLILVFYFSGKTESNEKRRKFTLSVSTFLKRAQYNTFLLPLFITRKGITYLDYFTIDNNL